jgi:hypothetical protein
MTHSTQCPCCEARKQALKQLQNYYKKHGKLIQAEAIESAVQAMGRVH